MLVQLFPPTPHRCWRDLDSILYIQSRVRTLFETRFFFSRKDQRVCIVEHYFSTRSYAECQKVCYKFCPRLCSAKYVQFNVSSSGCTDEKRRSGRPSVLSNDNLEGIRASLLQSPRQSLRKLSQQTGMTYGWLQMATKRLKLHPYRVPRLS
jgi:hypothetical protein